MAESVSTGSRAEFLARVQRFTDELLESLTKASRGKDVDEKEARTLRSDLLKSLRIWGSSLPEEQGDSRPEEKPRRAEKPVSQVKTGEG